MLIQESQICEIINRTSNRGNLQKPQIHRDTRWVCDLPQRILKEIRTKILTLFHMKLQEFTGIFPLLFSLIKIGLALSSLGAVSPGVLWTLFSDNRWVENMPCATVNLELGNSDNLRKLPGLPKTKRDTCSNLPAMRRTKNAVHGQQEVPLRIGLH